MVRALPFYTNKTKEITKQPKIYFIDTGMRNSVMKKFDIEPAGNLFENYVFSELVKLGFEPKYWRTKSNAEVDFVIEKDGNSIPIEAKLNASPDKIERSLQSFIEAYKPKTAIIVTYKGKKGIIMVNGCKIIFTDILEMRKILG